MKKIMCLIILSLSLFNLESKDVKKAKNSKENWITIFVHGCVALRSNFNLRTFRRLLRDNIECSNYESNVLDVRNKPFLFGLQPMQEQGLIPVGKKPNCTSGAFALGQVLEQQNKHWHINQKNKYYTYGWTGLLSNKQRYCDSQIFYREIKKELNKLKKEGINPKIRIISYSHGALLSLNLSKVRKCDNNRDNFKIDQLITLGMPVHNDTYELLDTCFFKEIFHIYSKSDYVQRLDIFGHSGFFSQKRFFGCLPNNLTQIELRISGPLLKIPGKCVPSSMRNRSIDQSPGHIEMWFFGWAPKGYRKNFILYPLPAASLVPYLIKTAKSYKKYSQNIKINIKPDKEISVLKSRDCRICEIIPFLNITEFTRLKWFACKYHPGQKKNIEQYIQTQRNIHPGDYK